MNPFTTALIKAPKRSRFDFDHSNTFGLRAGVLTPTLSRFIVPGDEVSISAEQIIRLAPMPVPTFVNLKVRHDFFFVPLRLLYGPEYLDKLFGSDTTIPRASFDSLESLVNCVNYFSLKRDSSGIRTHYTQGSYGYPFVPGCLCDYLRYPVFTDRNGALGSADLNQLSNALSSWGSTFDGSVSNVPKVLALAASGPVVAEPLFAYHFIWRDWYRFTGIEDNSIVESYFNNGILSQWNSGGSPICSFSGNGSNNDFANNNLTAVFSSMAPYINGSFKFGELGRFHYAHLKKDLFTSVRYGSKPTVLIPTGSNGTIPALREASAIQRFIDILSITGQRYFDKVKGVFGVEPSGYKDDRCQFLARYQQFIKVGEVLTTASTVDSSNNVISQTGDYAGRGVLVDGRYLFKRRFTEHGWLMCITSVVPDVAYSGLSRELSDVYPLDTPVPSLAQVGDQTVFNKEVCFSYLFNGANNASFGDQFRYYAYKSAPSEVHGFFLMDTARPWSPLLPYMYPSDPIQNSKVLPGDWNFLFNDTSDEYMFGDRFFFNVDFYEKITRCLPKYINYHL